MTNKKFNYFRYMEIESEKLNRTISSMRLKESTDDGILEMAKKKNRKKKEFMQMTWDIIVKRYKEGNWDYKDLY